jgi:hypothetical protein
MRRFFPLMSFHACDHLADGLFCTFNATPMNTHLIRPMALCGLLAGMAPVTAQVTILSDDVLQVGDRYRLAVDDAPTVDFGEPGNNMTWDFTDLNNTWDYTMETMLAVDAPLGPVAPGAIAAVTSLDNAAYQYDVNANALKYTGDAWDEEVTPFGLAHTPARVQLQFPAQVGQQFSGTSRSVLSWHVGEDIGWGFVVDSLRRRTHYDYNYVIDGWGQLSTPNGFFICLRVNTLINTVDSIDAKPVGSSSWTTDLEIMDMATREVAYWSPNHSLPVLRLLDQGDWGFVSGAVWIAEQELSTAVPEPQHDVHFFFHPNPAMDHVTLVTEGPGEKRYRLMMTDGKVMQEGRLVGQQGTIPLQHVAPGAYILEVRDGQRVQQQRLIKQ